MTDRIEPALTPEEWANKGYPAIDGYFDFENCVVDTGGGWGGEPGRFIPGLIALANAALPDDDKRKFRREHIAALRNATVRDVIGDEDREQTSILRNLADALESYLPPE